MTYTVKEIYKTIQGEGARTGRVAIFCRFSGCNLWSGREQDRSKAICKFCDTDFFKGRKLQVEALANEIEQAWGNTLRSRFVVFTGGEPLLQLNAALIREMKKRLFSIAVETNGTIAAPAGIDWITVSPKADTVIKQTDGDELKLVYPQLGLDPSSLEEMFFHQFFLQPMDGKELKANTQAAITYCLEHPMWRLSVQTHKLLGLP